MKIFFTLILACCTNAVLAQFAIIHDRDGFCNIRSKAEIADNIIDTLYNGHLVYTFEKKGKWISIDYAKGEKELRGEVYIDRVKPISAYQDIPIVTKNDHKVVLTKDSIKIIITEQRFDRKKYKLSFHKEYKTQLEFIDNKQYWGTDGEIPTTEYKAIDVYIGKRKVRLSRLAMANLFQVSLHTTKVYYDIANDILYIQSMNSDGAGSYDVVWKVEKGIYKERYIVYGF